MSLLTTERATYEGIWSSVPAYGDNSPGEQHLPIFLQIVGDPLGQSVLDAGSGSGKGALALFYAGFNVRMCDVTDAGLVPEAKASIPFLEACLWHELPFVSKYVYCCDVLEHIPPQFTMLAIRNMLTACTHGLFLTVSLVPDNFGAWAGKPLHQSVYPFAWWRDNLKEIGEVVEARDLLSNGVFYVRPK